MHFNDFFDSRYPIIAAAMNQVSNCDLAVACHNAGIFPSISALTYSKNYIINYDDLERAIDQYQTRTGTNKILISVAIGDLLGKQFYNLVKKYNLENLEIIGNDCSYPKEEKELYLEYLSTPTLKLFPKVLGRARVNPRLMHGIILKGKDGAGRSVQDINEDEELLSIKSQFPSLPIVMSGGIGSNKDIKKYMEMGCIGVAIGTLFAASEESCISKETKLKMIESSSNEIKRLDAGAQQNAIVFSRIEEDDFNNTNSLNMGMKDPTKGHIFAGKGIDHIKSILPVKDIVQLLVDGL
jgi:nitronate monooxygenase